MANNSSTWGLSRLGANFSDSNMIRPTFYHSYNITPTIINKSGPITDTLNWQLITGTFTANGNEQFLTIGWFGDQYGELGKDSGVVNYTYYYVDSLNLELKNYKNTFVDDCNTTTTQLKEINLITPNNDGYNDNINFNIFSLQKLSFEVYNRWSNLVYKTQNINDIWQGTNQNKLLLPAGTYY